MITNSEAKRLSLGIGLLLFLPVWLFFGEVQLLDVAHYGFQIDNVIVGLLWLTIFLLSVRQVIRGVRLAVKLRSCLIGYVFIGCIASAMAAFFLYYFFTFPIGARWIPDKPPSEDRRVFHPQGFSIVPPPGWKVRVSNLCTNDKIGMGMCFLSFNPGTRARHAPGLSAILTSPPENLKDYNEIKFFGLKAYEKISISHGRYTRLNYTLQLYDGNMWYRLGYSETTGLEVAPPNIQPEIMAYINSFRPPQKTNSTVQ